MTRIPTSVFVLMLVVPSVVAVAQAGGQTSSSPQGTSRTPGAAGQRPAGEYAGVVPGRASRPPAARRAQRRVRSRRGPHRLVTWPGFQPRAGGVSRFFVQTMGSVETEMVSEQGRVVVLLKNTRIHLRNNRRPLETQFFNTPVNRARVERRGRDAALILEMRAQVTPTVTTQDAGDGYFYVFIEFPGGEYLPEEPRPSVSPASPAAP